MRRRRIALAAVERTDGANRDEIAALRYPLVRMSSLTVRLKKGRGGPDSLTCVRSDGTQTWERLPKGIAVHDLTHFAVESELGLANGFYGLLASGWSITGFLEREARRELSRDSVAVEFLVGRFWQEAADGSRPSADEFNATLASIEATRPGVAIRRVTSDELERVRTTLADLIVRWHSIAPGESLELEFSAERIRA